MVMQIRQLEILDRHDVQLHWLHSVHHLLTQVSAVSGVFVPAYRKRCTG